MKKIIAVPEKGEIYKGIVKSITSFGAFVEILPGKEGLLHISEVSWERIMNVEDVLREGDEVEVKLIELERDGKLKLSRKALLPKPEGYVEKPAGERPPRRDGGRRDYRGGGRRDYRDRKPSRDRE